MEIKKTKQKWEISCSGCRKYYTMEYTLPVGKRLSINEVICPMGHYGTEPFNGIESIKRLD